MERVRGELRAVSWLLAGDAIARVIGQVAIIVTARLLGPEAYGALAVALAVLSMMVILVDFGVGDAAVRELTAGPNGAIRFREGPARIRFWLATPYLPLGSLLVFVADDPLVRASGFALAALPFAVTLFGRAQESRCAQDFRSVSTWSAALLLCQWLGGLGGALLGRTADAATAGVVVALAVLSATTVAGHSRIIPPRREFKSWLKRGKPYFVTAGSVALYSRGDRIVLACLLGASVAGPYAAAYGLIMLAAIAGAALHSALLPRLLRDFAADAGDAWMRRVLILGAAITPLSIGAFLSAPWVVPLIFGEEFSAAISILRWLSPLATLYVVNPVLSSCLIAAGRQRSLAIVALVNLGCAAVLYPALVTTMGASGAALASVIVECLGLVMCTAILLRHSERASRWVGISANVEWENSNRG